MTQDGDIKLKIKGETLRLVETRQEYLVREREKERGRGEG